MPDMLHSAWVRNWVVNREGVGVSLQSEAHGLELISQGSVLTVWPQAEAIRRWVDQGYLFPSKPLDPGAVNCLSSHQSRFTPILVSLESASPCLPTSL